MSERITLQPRVDRYLEALRSGLRPLPADQAQNIVNEIRSHINDVSQFTGEPAEATVTAALRRLGSPAALASTYVASAYVAGDLLPPGKRRRLPRPRFRSALRWAGLSVVGLFGSLGVLAGYGLAGLFALCALAKPFSPSRAGLWKLGADDISLQLGVGDPPAAPGAHELLGWWIIPVGLIAAVVLILLTTAIVRYAIRAFQRERHGFRQTVSRT
jgi:hypothetical protein